MYIFSKKTDMSKKTPLPALEFLSLQNNNLELYLNIIKTHGSESRGQEEAACMRVFWPTRPLQWVIYTDGSSKILKCCNSAIIAVLLTQLQSNWVESTSQRWNISAQPFWRTSQPEIFDDGFRDYSQNSSNIHNVS